MAYILSSLSSLAIAPPPRRLKSVAGFNGLKACPVVRLRIAPLTMRTSHSSRSLKVSCDFQASPEVVEKVVSVVSEQLAKGPGEVHPHSKFQDLGADSLDQVEIVMRLEEEFNVRLDEDKAETIATVQDAANLIHRVATEVGKTT